MPNQTISFSPENYAWIYARGKQNLSAFVNEVLDKERMEKSNISLQDLQSIRKYINRRNIIGTDISVRAIIHEAILQYLNQSSFFMSVQSNTGYEKSEPSNTESSI